MLHDEDAHHLLAPQDIPGHLARDHGTYQPPVGISTFWAQHFLEARGIEPTGDDTVDLAHAWHEYVHDMDSSEWEERIDKLNRARETQAEWEERNGPR